jgi:uncharacterized protein (TIGR02001 family)
MSCCVHDDFKMGLRQSQLKSLPITFLPSITQGSRMKKIHFPTSWPIVLTALFVIFMGQSAFAAEPQAKLTGNMSFVGDYRFRGFTQTNYGPAIQGGLDWEHQSGFYAGNWNSNVAQNLYNGASLEMDFYGGFKGVVPGLLGSIGDIGAIYYLYPKSGVDSIGIDYANKAINNTEVYVGLSNGPLSLKVNYANSDYFRYAYIAGAPLSTRGTTYLDLSYSKDYAGLIWGAHVGVLNLKNFNQRKFLMATDVGSPGLVQTVNDYRLSVGHDFGGNSVLSASYYTTSQRGYFQTDLTGLRSAGKPGLVLGFAKGF